MKRKGSAVWMGGLKDGKGTVSTESGVLKDAQYSFSTRFEHGVCTPGTLLFGVSGHVNTPGVYELPTGTLLTDIIYNYAGGVPNNKKVLCVIPGGTSMPPIRGDKLEGVKMDAESLKEVGSAIGTGGVIVMDEDTDLVKVLARIAHFFTTKAADNALPAAKEQAGLKKF